MSLGLRVVMRYRWSWRWVLMVTATMLVDGAAGLTMQKSVDLSMVVSIVVEMVEQTAYGGDGGGDGI